MPQETLKELIGFDPETGVIIEDRSGLILIKGNIGRTVKPAFSEFASTFQYVGDVRAIDVDEETGLLVSTSVNGDHIRRSYYRRQPSDSIKDAFTVTESIHFYGQRDSYQISSLLLPDAEFKPLRGMQTLVIKGQSGILHLLIKGGGQIDSIAFQATRSAGTEFIAREESLGDSYKYETRSGIRYKIQKHDGYSLERDTGDTQEVINFPTTFPRGPLNSAIDPDFFRDPLNVKPYLDILWRGIDLKEVFGINWQRS